MIPAASGPQFYCHVLLIIKMPQLTFRCLYNSSSSSDPHFTFVPSYSGFKFFIDKTNCISQYLTDRVFLKVSKSLRSTMTISRWSLNGTSMGKIHVLEKLRTILSVVLSRLPKNKCYDIGLDCVKWNYFSRSSKIYQEIVLQKEIITIGNLMLERFSIECRKTKPKPITYHLDYSGNLQPLLNQNQSQNNCLPSTLKWKPL